MMNNTPQSKEITFPRAKVCGIRYQAPNSDYKIFSAEILFGNLYLGEFLTIKGNLANIRVGDEFELTVIEKQNDTYGLQFELQSWSRPIPTDEAGLLKYLKNNFTGIGEKKARNLINEFGVDVIKVLESPDSAEVINNRLKWSPKQTDKFLGQWKSAVLPKRVELMLLGAGVTNRQINKIKEDFGDAYAQIVLETPYKLTTVHGIGFLTADKIALKNGLSREDPARVWAGSIYALEQTALNGHCYLPQTEFIAEITKLLKIPANVIIEVVNAGCPGDLPLIKDSNSDWWLLKYYRDEQIAADYLKILRQTKPLFDFNLEEKGWDLLFSSFQIESGIQLTSEQMEAVKLAMREKVMVITGNPGTGKTTILKAILFSFEYFGLTEFELCAPTGKASRRMAEATGRETKTIHRMLGLGKGELTFSYANPLPAEMVSVDEMSMVDISLFASLVSSLQKTCRLILIGDRDQLASVGAGRVLQDLLESGIPHVRLTQPQRQAAQSMIIRAAHSINKGEFPPLGEYGSKDNVWFSSVTNEQEAQNNLLKIISFLQTKNIEFNRVRILSPMKKGVCGVFNLNTLLQELINPAQPNLKQTNWRSVLLREGDKLIQLKNDYNLDLMNGEEVTVDFIKDSHKEQEKEVNVGFFSEDGREFEIPMSEIDMQHSYALTIHKSQGSEYDVVILFCLESQLGFYSRKMLYTGLTRAKKLAFIIGNKLSLTRVIGRNQEVRRRTKLIEKLFQSTQKV